LRKGKLRKLIKSNLVPLALPAPHVVLVLHRGKLGCGPVAPSHDVLRFVELLVQFTRDFLAEAGNDCRLKFWMCPPKNNRVNFLGFVHAELITAQHVVFDKCEGLTGTSGSAKQAVWRKGFVERLLVRVSLVVVLIALNAIRGLKAHNALLLFRRNLNICDDLNWNAP